jgi:hypothetical protein
MDNSLASLQVRWSIVRILCLVLAFATSLSTLWATPIPWWPATASTVVFALTTAFMSVTYWRRVWIRLTLLSQAVLFIVGLFSSVFVSTAAESLAPVLLLAFCLILGEEHALTSALRYSAQFSQREKDHVSEFNAQALNASLNDLYRKLTSGGIVFVAGFLLSASVATLGEIGGSVWLLSDPALYVIVASISLAFLVALKTD